MRGKDGKELGEIVIPKREVTLEEWKASLKDQEAAIQPMVRSAG